MTTVDGHRLTRTKRLTLRAVAEGDLAELHALHADPRVWRHLPSGRHESEERTRAMIDRSRRGWRESGLDHWTAHETDGGAFIGIGGADLRRGAAWNVYYRLVPEAQGQGYAQEIVAAARTAAAATRPELPVVAYLLEHNEGSRRTAERAGLELRWRGPEPGLPDATRLVYADRPLDAAALAAFIG